MGPVYEVLKSEYQRQQEEDYTLFTKEGDDLHKRGEYGAEGGRQRMHKGENDVIIAGEKFIQPQSGGGHCHARDPSFFGSLLYYTHIWRIWQEI